MYIYISVYDSVTHSIYFWYMTQLIKMNPRLKSMIKENHEVTKTSLAGDGQEEQQQEKAAGSEEIETSKDEGNKSKNEDEDEGDDMLGGGDEDVEESGNGNTSENKEKEPEAETKQDGAWQAFYDPLKVVGLPLPVKQCETHSLTPFHHPFIQPCRGSPSTRTLIRAARGSSSSCRSTSTPPSPRYAHAQARSLPIVM
jgi:hypothetical protein